MIRLGTICKRLSTRPAAQRQKGTALIVVLWIAVLLSALLAGALTLSRGEARNAHARAETLKARAAAQSGLDLAAYRIAVGSAASIDALAQSANPSINGYSLRFEPGQETRKLDINLATEQTFEALFAFAGVDFETAQKLAARIADWRDTDDLVRLNGAERSDYAAARNGETIGNRPFYAVNELKKVLGFPPALHDCLAPALTVFGTAPLPDPVLMNRLYGASPFDRQTASGVRLSTSNRAARAGSRFSVTVTAAAQRRQHRLSGLFRITGGAETPYKTIAVYEGNFNEAENAASASACSISSTAPSKSAPRPGLRLQIPTSV